MTGWKTILKIVRGAIDKEAVTGYRQTGFTSRNSTTLNCILCLYSIFKVPIVKKDVLPFTSITIK